MSFKYCASAILYQNYGGVGIYVRYRKGADKIEVRHSDGRYVWVETPDRELVITFDGFSDLHTRPLDCNFDEYVALNPFSASFKDSGIEYLMTNYHQHLKRIDRSPEHRRPENTRPDGITYMSDSGGFQILMGRVDYLNPMEVQKWYNANTDIGIVLDIPCSMEHEHFERVAHIQKRNLELMLAVQEPHVELMNVVHGSNTEYMKQFHDIVYDDRCKSLCIANMYAGSLVHTVCDAMEAVEFTEGQYPHYHLLGIFNPLVLLPYIRYANSEHFKKRGALLTSDSSSHIQGAISYTYFHQADLSTPLKRRAIGVREKAAFPSPNRLLPCSCPICSTIKYTDVLSGMVPGAMLNFLLTWHNIFESNRYVNQLDDVAKTLSDADYTEVAKAQLSESRYAKDGLKALEFVHEVMKSGSLPKTKTKFHYWFDFSRLLKFKEQQVIVDDMEGVGGTDGGISTHEAMEVMDPDTEVEGEGEYMGGKTFGEIVEMYETRNPMISSNEIQKPKTKKNSEDDEDEDKPRNLSRINRNRKDQRKRRISGKRRDHVVGKAKEKERKRREQRLGKETGKAQAQKS